MTKVRPPGDGNPPSYSSAPYVRSDTDEDWKKIADMSGLASRALDGPGPAPATAYPDIETTRGTGYEDAPTNTYWHIDHNRYFRDNVTNVDATQTRRLGGQWLLFKKFHHGRMGLMDYENPHLPIGIATVDVDDTYPSTAAPGDNLLFWNQIKYADEDGVTYADGTGTDYEANYPGGGTARYLTMDVDVTYSVIVNGTETFAAHQHNIGTVNRLTGIVTRSCEKTVTSGSMAADWSLGRWNTNYPNVYFGIVSFFANFSLASGEEHGFVGFNAYRETTVSPGEYEFRIDTGYGSNVLLSKVSMHFGATGGSFSRTHYFFDPYLADRGRRTETCTITNTGLHFVQETITLDGAGNSNVETYVEDLQLRDPYTTAECLLDLYALAAEWDLSDFTLGVKSADGKSMMRQDELLALAPLIIYDEVPDVVLPSIAPWDNYDNTMEDYAATPYTGVERRTWVDPNNFQWIFPDGRFTMPAGFAGGATYEENLRTTFAISHNFAGSDRHFWFQFQKKERFPTCDAFNNVDGHQFILTEKGAYSSAALPAVTLRWMNNEEAMTDPDGEGGYGNQPQDWVRYIGGVMTGGKYVEAALPWPSVNYARPCGWDKFAVDNSTVCAVVDSGAGFFTVRPTGAAIDPLAAGGLAVNDYIIVESAGIYKITGIALVGGLDADGLENWTVSVGALLDTLPTGYTMSTTVNAVPRLGRLRWPEAPGVCGRVAITTTESGGVVTITSATSIPTLRMNVVDGTYNVDICDASMTLLATAALTRISDTQWTFVHAAVPTAAYMVKEGGRLTWDHNDTTTKRTGVRLRWHFDERAKAKLTRTQPNWLGGTGAGTGTGVAGCTDLSIQEFTYNSAKCRAIVGGVPYYSGVPDDLGDIPPAEAEENFINDVLHPMDDVILLDLNFGGYFLGATEMTMVDPFWQQTPFVPDAAAWGDAYSVDWREDTGEGALDDDSGSPKIRYYSHRPWVEAASNVPAGKTLGGGVSLFYAPGSAVSPQYYPLGIPCTQDSGGCPPTSPAGGEYVSIERPWGFKIRACDTIGAGGRFSSDYAKFTRC